MTRVTARASGPRPVPHRPRLLRAVGPQDVGAEGALLAAEVIAAVRDTPGVSGVHLLTAGYEKQIPRLLRMAGVDRSALAGNGLAGKSRDGH